MSKGYASEMMVAGRMLSHGKIATLPFSLGSNPFSIFIIPKTTPDPIVPVMVNCKLYLDDTETVCPFNIHQWTEPAIINIPAEAIDLTLNDVYWGAGADVSES